MIDYDAKPDTYRGVVEVYSSASAVDAYPVEWFWRVRGRNGQKIGSGHESFTRRAEAVASVDRLLSAQLKDFGTDLVAATTPRRSRRGVLSSSIGTAPPTEKEHCTNDRR